MKRKSDFFSIFTTFQSLVQNQFSTNIGIFQCDGGGEFISNQLLLHFKQCGIKQLFSCPHTPQQNGLAERKHKHIVELGLSLLFQSKAPQKFWVEAFVTANFLSNLLPHSALPSAQSPYEKLHNKKPSYSSLRVFGSSCYPMLRPYTQNKLDPRSLTCEFLGYSEKHKGYRCLFPPTGRVYISRHVIFDESKFPFSYSYKHLYPQATTPLLSAWHKGVRISPTETQTSVTNSVFDHNSSVSSTHSVPVFSSQGSTVPSDTTTSRQNLTTTRGESSGHLQEARSNYTVSPPSVVMNQHQMTTRLKAGIVKPNPRYALLTDKVASPEPRTLAEALKHPGWNAAMTEEMDNCKLTKTWSLVPHTPDMHVLGNRWIHRTKYNADGTVKSLRSQLVVQGCGQEEGVDYLETYNPVVRTSTVRIALHIATVFQWDIKQLDVANAFLHGDLNETVYMRQPSGFVDKTRSDHVCLLHKSLYGLKQSPRAWFDKFSTFLLEFGFVCSIKDPSLFIYAKGKNIILLLLYVDDMLLTGNCTDLLQKLLADLNNQFRMKDLGKMHYFLGIQAIFHESGLFLSQERYARDLLAVAGMTDCALVNTPLPLQLSKAPHQDKKFENPS